MELIRLEDIRKTYHLGEVEVPVLRGISLSIQRGDMVALMGASGSGKTTLMNILGCLDQPTSGKYWLDGQEMSGLTSNQRALVRTEKLGFVFQSFNLLSRTTALQNIIMPLNYSTQRCSSGEANRVARMLLSRVGLADRANHEPSQMSGGQQQRVAVARALVNHPALVLADEPTGNLDSHTSVEILRMFQQLNAEGITVVLVTHDPSVASYAHRTIRIVDGMIEEDETLPEAPITSTPHARHGMSAPHSDAPYDGGNGDDRSDDTTTVIATQRAEAVAVATESRHHTQATTELKPLPGKQSSECHDDAPLKPRRWVAPALLPATWRTALSALRRNKMRSGLSALGVIIAVAAVIAMMEIGQGAKTALQKGIASMGANMLMISPASTATGGVNQGAGSTLTLTPQDADEIARQCPAVSDVAPAVRARAQIIYANRNWIPEQIIGTTPSHLAVRDWQNMAKGEMFAERDVRNGNKVCVIGNTVKRNLFSGVSPIDKEIRINNVSFRVIGVLSRKGANMIGMDQDNIVLAPWTTIKYRVSGTTLANTNQSASAGGNSSSNNDAVNTLSGLYPAARALYPSRSSSQIANYPQPVRFTNVDVIMAKAASDTKLAQAVSQITELLRERHRTRVGDEDDFSITNMAEITTMFSTTTQVMSILLLVVALISLVVGGVGIMNIMLVSVTERTREIGLRMAVGARSYHILRQFLVEAVVLCLVGSAIGILLGRGMSLVVRWKIHWPTEASWSMIVAAVAVSVGVGIAFGFYPAWKASHLHPIEALRYE